MVVRVRVNIGIDSAMRDALMTTYSCDLPYGAVMLMKQLLVVPVWIETCITLAS